MSILTTVESHRYHYAHLHWRSSEKAMSQSYQRKKQNSNLFLQDLKAFIPLIMLNCMTQLMWLLLILGLESELITFPTDKSCFLFVYVCAWHYVWMNYLYGEGSPHASILCPINLPNVTDWKMSSVLKKDEITDSSTTE